MNDSIRELASVIAGLKEQAARLKAAVAADGQAADDLKQRLADAGVEGGPVARLSGCAAGCERADSQLDALEARLERARFIAMSAINGLYGSGAVTRSGDQADDPTSWPKPTSGTELAESDEPKQSARRNVLRMMIRKGDEVDDAVNSTAKTATQWYTYANSDETPPEVGATTETVAVAPTPVIRAADQTPLDTGIALMGAVVANLVAAKGKSSAAKVAKNVFGRWRKT